MKGKDITDTVWDYLQGEETTIAKRILKALDYDICHFIAYNDTVLIEKTYSSATIPNYLFDYIQQHNDKIIAFSAGVIG
jgi:hypothetical protein